MKQNIGFLKTRHPWQEIVFGRVEQTHHQKVTVSDQFFSTPKFSGTKGGQRSNYIGSSLLRFWLFLSGNLLEVSFGIPEMISNVICHKESMNEKQISYLTTWFANGIIPDSFPGAMTRTQPSKVNRSMRSKPDFGLILHDLGAPQVAMWTWQNWVGFLRPNMNTYVGSLNGKFIQH